MTELHYTLTLTGGQLTTLKDLALAGAAQEAVPMNWPIAETLDAIAACIRRGPDEYKGDTTDD